MVRGLIGVARGSPSPVAIMVPGRPSTAAALSGVPFRIACINGLIPPRETGVGMPEGRGTNATHSRLVCDMRLPVTDADIRDGVGGSKDR